MLPHFYVVGPAGIVGAADGYILDTTGPGNTLRPYLASRDSYNFAPFNDLQRPDQRYTAGLMAHYEVSPHAEEWRKIGVFAVAVAVPEDAPLLDRLLGLTGRDPDAT